MMGTTSALQNIPLLVNAFFRGNGEYPIAGTREVATLLYEEIVCVTSKDDVESSGNVVVQVIGEKSGKIGMSFEIPALVLCEPLIPMQNMLKDAPVGIRLQLTQNGIYPLSANDVSKKIKAKDHVIVTAKHNVALIDGRILAGENTAVKGNVIVKVVGEISGQQGGVFRIPEEKLWEPVSELSA